MGFQRDVIEALTSNSREPLETVDQAIEVMYDPRRHGFTAGDDFLNQLGRITGASCLICMNNEAEHNPGGQRDDGRVTFIVPQPPTQLVGLNEYLSKMKEEPQEAPAASDEEMQTCDICYEERPVSQFFGLSCEHKFCKVCLSEHLETNIKDGQVVKIPCMQHGCAVEFEESDVKLFGSEEIFKKYVRFKMNINVDLDPNLRWCPRNGCMNFVRRPNRLRKRAVCACGQEVCMRCGAVYHGWVRCANVGDAEFIQFARANNVKPCPKCRIPTDKYTGCNHITCQKCRYEWCWVCYGNYRAPGGHYGGPIFFCPGSQFGDSNDNCTLFKILLLILFGPIGMLLVPILAGLIAPLAILFTKRSPELINLILTVLALPLGNAAGIVAGCLLFAICAIPFEFVQCIRFFRLLFAKCNVYCCMKCCWI